MTNVTEKMLVADINQLSEEYYALSQELALIAERKATEWLNLRRSCKTNTETDHTWTATADGKREAYLHVYLKGLEKLRGARILEYRANSGQL